MKGENCNQPRVFGQVNRKMKLGIEGDSPDSISQYYSINTDNP